ncbi:FAD-linked oxidase [Thozetella sp. PMI_491]|nr:FAD-linked oxidase [Thozetella sp. PMI_491]
MDMQSLILGSEGSLGIITSAIVKIFPIPQVQRYGSILFKSFGDGLGFMYDLAQTNQAPASVRLVDNGQFQFSQALKPASTGWRAIKSRLEKAYVIGFLKFDPERMVACTVLFEGRASEVKTQEQTVYRLAKSHGGMKAGAENGRRGYEMTFAIAYIRDFAMGVDLIAESFETSCPWTCALELCEGVKQRVRDEHKARGLPGRPFVSARISQVYDTGVTVYFYLAIFAGGVAKPSEAFGELERAARDEILLQGGSLSHHHGVGTLRRKFLPRVLSPGALSVRETVARAIDPDGVFRDLA